jgi:transcriptional regulator with XRE-family HTH domain
MGKTVEAIVEPALLVWARERAGLQIEAAAKKAQIQVARLVSWEKGETRPTIAQVRRLGTVYKRPLAVFYLPRPPKGFDSLRDFLLSWSVPVIVPRWRCWSAGTASCASASRVVRW